MMLMEERNVAALEKIKPKAAGASCSCSPGLQPIYSNSKKRQGWRKASEKQGETEIRATAVTGSRPGAARELPSWVSYVPASKSTEEFRIQRKHSHKVVPKVYVSSSLKLLV